jgi:murein DD-endopeptidase MepM/ murein hydrolase activator NlpD
VRGLLSIGMAAVLLMTVGSPADAGVLPSPPGAAAGAPQPILPSLPLPLPLPSLPLPLPTLPLPTLPSLPVIPPPIAHPQPTTPAGPGTQAGGAPGAAGAQPPGPAPPAAAGAGTPGSGTAIGDDPSADLYPQPPVDPAVTAQARLVAQLNDVEHRVQYLHNVLARTQADLAVAQARLGSLGPLITLLTAPGGTSSAASNARGGPIVALSEAVADGQAELARREEEAQALQQQVNSGFQQTLASSVPVPAAATTYLGGKLRRPIPGTITSRFGNRFDPYYHVWQLHPGIDIGAPPGTSIVAAAGGRVSQAGWYGGYGNYTCIDHGYVGGARLSTCYGHQRAILVSPGQLVSAGQVIGQVGSTGASTGPHLHFEVRLGGRPVDPMPWI